MQSHRARLTTAFDGEILIASGPLETVLAAAWPRIDTARFFDDGTGRIVELDLRGDLAAALDRLPEEPPGEADGEEDAAPAPRGPGRPKLGVVAREITLLPRHWDWLATQPGGASVTLRKLVEAARREGFLAERARRAKDVAYRFMGVMAGDRPGFEEASRALFAGDAAGFETHTADWPKDVAAHTKRLAAEAFSPTA